MTKEIEASILAARARNNAARSSAAGSSSTGRSTASNPTAGGGDINTLIEEARARNNAARQSAARRSGSYNAAQERSGLSRDDYDSRVRRTYNSLNSEAQTSQNTGSSANASFSGRLTSPAASPLAGLDPLGGLRTDVAASGRAGASTSRLDAQVSAAENEASTYAHLADTTFDPTERNNYLEQAEAARQRAEELRSQQEEQQDAEELRRQSYAEMMKNADFAQGSRYNSTYRGGEVEMTVYKSF